MPQELSSIEDLTTLQADSTCKFVVFFWAEWHEPSKLGGQMQEVFTALEQKYSKLKFTLVEAEIVPELSEKLGVTLVPTFFTCVGSKVVDKLEGATPPTLSKMIKALDELNDSQQVISLLSDDKTSAQKTLSERLERLIHTAPVMLFMKGSNAQPKCGFSRQLIEILTQFKIPFASFDILTDEAVRTGLKEYSDWPTYPQLYVQGTLIGGLDIIKEMAQSGNLAEELGIESILSPPAAPKPLQERLQELINQAPVMLFMKGNPDLPRCGFSKTIVSILQEANIEFSSFNILSDEEVRAGLKEYSDWPTYPQLYAKGQLVGGLDIVKEMVEGGNLKQQLGI
jgi:Grx4 family monothiol glutaredoxin